MAIKVGEIFKTNNSVDIVVVKYVNSTNITIKFLDEHGYEMSTDQSSIRRGRVKNPFHRSVMGFGYLGVGKFVAYKNGKYTDEYMHWSRMIDRCYGNRGTRKSYQGCTVSDEWANFQVFAEWLVSQKGYSGKCCVDKDILIYGNKLYSKDTCCVVPVKINSLLTSHKEKRGSTSIGVSKMKGRYSAQVKIDGITRFIGAFDSEEEAFEAYRKEKTAYISRVVNSDYADILPDNVKQAILSYPITKDM